MTKKPKLVSSNPGLEVNNLRKSLSGKQIVRNISMKVEKGKVIGLLGPNGAGKTSLVDLITLTNQPDNGQLQIDDVLHSLIKKSTWRNQIGYVSQDTIIFDDTIANNIAT